MTSATVLGPAYIIAARRTALGRPGGLHRSRRLESLTAPVVLAALEDARLEAAAVEEIIFGNTTAGGNPARLVGLAAGLRDSVPALTVDRQCASGLDAILLGMRAVALGEARVVVAGGGESLSDGTLAGGAAQEPVPDAALHRPGARGRGDRRHAPFGHGIGGIWLVGSASAATGRMPMRCHSHLKAEQATSERRFLREIVPLRKSAEETRDQGIDVRGIEDLAELAPIMPPDGTHTSGNISALQEGAAAVVIVSARFMPSSAARAPCGWPPASRRASAPTRKRALRSRRSRSCCAPTAGSPATSSALVEMSETSAAQALAVRDAFDLDDAELSPDGGALVRGYPLGAASAVSVVRLFTRLIRVPAEWPAALRRRHPRRHRGPRCRRPVRGGLLSARGYSLALQCRPSILAEPVAGSCKEAQRARPAKVAVTLTLARAHGP